MLVTLFPFFIGADFYFGQRSSAQIDWSVKFKGLKRACIEGTNDTCFLHLFRLSFFWQWIRISSVQTLDRIALRTITPACPTAWSRHKGIKPVEINLSLQLKTITALCMQKRNVFTIQPSIWILSPCSTTTVSPPWQQKRMDPYFT